MADAATATSVVTVVKLFSTDAGEFKLSPMWAIALKLRLIVLVRAASTDGSFLRVEATRSATVSEEAVATDSEVAGLLDSEVVADWLVESLSEADRL